MSQTLDTNTMIAQLQARIPMGLSSAYCMQELNKAWRWLEQQGAFVWNVRSTTVAVPLNGTTFPLPGDVDMGKDMLLFPTSLASYATAISYVPFDQVATQLQFAHGASQTTFSVWTIASISGTLKGSLYPILSSSPALTLGFIYHHMVGPQLTAGNGIFFPTPDVFDDALIDLAEGEIKRNYSMSGWDWAQKKAENAVLKELDQYRSGKRELEGMVEEAQRGAEMQSKIGG